MRPRRTLRKTRPVQLAAGALMLAVPAAGAAVITAAPADAQSALQIELSSSHLGYGSDLRVSGTAPSGTAGEAVELQYAAAGSPSWQPLQSTTIGNDGRFEFVAAIGKSGLVRAVATPSTRRYAQSTASALLTLAGTAAAGELSDPSAVMVVPKFDLLRSVDVLAGSSIRIAGKLLPAVPGRDIRLQERTSRGWRTIESDPTGPSGRFVFSYHESNRDGAGGQQLRVQFRGDSLNTGSATSAGRATVFEQRVASWYEDAGSTACGFHAGLGVANKQLPCGTKVKFRYGARTVTAVIDDRGPYVGGRTWDLNQNTAAALGFSGVDTVWSTA